MIPPWDRWALPTLFLSALKGGRNAEPLSRGLALEARDAPRAVPQLDGVVLARLQHLGRDLLRAGIIGAVDDLRRNDMRLRVEEVTAVLRHSVAPWPMTGGSLRGRLVPGTGR